MCVKKNFKFPFEYDLPVYVSHCNNEGNIQHNREDECKQYIFKKETEKKNKNEFEIFARTFLEKHFRSIENDQFHVLSNISQPVTPSQYSIAAATYWIEGVIPGLYTKEFHNFQIDSLSSSSFKLHLLH